jgi:uncharacterized membrane protein
MTQFVLIAVYAGLLVAAAAFAFMRPSGVYWRSVVGVGATMLIAAALWQLGSPLISPEDGLGVFLIWCAVTALAAGVATAACIAATLRHILNAIGARLT